MPAATYAFGDATQAPVRDAAGFARSETNIALQGTRAWTAIASSSDGARLVACAAGTGGQGDYIYTSTDSGRTWVQKAAAGKRGWGAVAISADGLRLLAACKYPTDSAADDVWRVYGGNAWHDLTDYVCLSTDGGMTWSPCVQLGSRRWDSVAISANGALLFASAADGVTAISADAGATWGSWATGVERLACSASGLNLLGLKRGFIYECAMIPDREGWRRPRPYAGLSAIALSGDASTALLSGAGYLRARRGLAGAWRFALGVAPYATGLAASANGSKLYACVPGGPIWVSSDGGASWRPSAAGSFDWSAIACSSDGIRATAAVRGGYLYTSSDAGVSWLRRG